MNDLFYFIKNKYLFLFSLAYFPLHIIAWWLWAKGIINFPYEIKGYFFLLLIIISMFLHLMSFLVKRTTSVDSYTLAVGVYMLYITLIVTINFFFNPPVSSFFLLSKNIGVISIWLAFFLVGLYLSSSHREREKFFLISTLSIALLLMTFFDGAFVVDYSDIEQEYRGVYLFTADFLAVCGFYYISKFSSLKIKAVFFVLFLILIFFSASRGALYFYIFSSAVVLLLYKPLLSTCLLLVFSGLFFLNLDFLISEYPRMFAVFNLSTDSSFNGREVQKMWGYIDLKQNPFIGAYANNYIIFEEYGSFIHNIFSYWRQFGLLAFLFFLIIVVLFPAYFLYRHYRNYSLMESNIQFLFMFYIFICVQIFFSRSYTWGFPWLFLPMFYSWLYFNRNDRNTYG